MFQILSVDFDWKKDELTSVLPILLSFIAFICYWFIAQSKKIKDTFYRKYDSDTASVKHIFFTKYIGFFSMGIIPLFICLFSLKETTPADYGLTFIPETFLFSACWTIGLCILVIPLAFISAKKPENLVNYPQIRTKKWTKKIFYINLLGWAIYLFGYELLFRGVLLFPLVKTIGIWPAIAINIALYSATHIPKGLAETVGAIPLGLVLCLLTLASGTIWIAFFVHVALAWTNSLTALKYHPEIHYIHWKKRN
jgi:membrane protease YdiL (CAAX protease family)